MHELIERVIRIDAFNAGDKAFVGCIQPSKLEWQHNFPKGAAGVYLTDGRIIVGDGSCLDHQSLMDNLSIDNSLEMFRLQLGHTKGFVELWIDEEYEATPEGVAAGVAHRYYGHTLEQISTMVTAACQRFYSGYQCRAIAKSDAFLEGGLDGDEAWMDSCW